MTLETFEHELQDYFQNHTSLLDLLIPEEDDSKVKRGLIDIGGTILKGLFGLSTEDDLNKVHNFVIDFNHISMIKTVSLFASEISMIIPQFSVDSKKFENYKKINTQI